MNRRLPCGISILVMLCTSTSVTGQARSAADMLRTARELNWWIRAAYGTGSLEGRVTGFSRDTVRIAFKPVAVDEVARIERQLQEGGGGLVGALAGGFVFGALGLTLASFCESKCTLKEIVWTAGGASGGVALGAALGDAVAPARRRWEVVWPH